MNVLLLSIPDYFEHMPPIAVRMPNGALTSLAGNVDSHHRIAVADLILASRRVRQRPRSNSGVHSFWVDRCFPKLAFILFPESDQALPVQSVQPARANRQRLWQGLWQALVTHIGFELLVGEAFKKTFEM
jgi:hypothetical protein